MERVMYNIHSQACSVALRNSSSRSRSLAEHMLLFIALCGFGVLCISHLSFVHRPDPLLTSTRSIPSLCLSSIKGFRRDVDITHIAISSDISESYAYTVFGETFDNRNADKVCSQDGDSTEMPSQLVCNDQDSSQTTPSRQDIVLSHSNTKGFLFLSPCICSQHNISTQYVVVSKTDATCFGEPFLQTLVHNFLGPDTVVLNWLVAASGKYGHVHNPRTKNVIDLKAYGSSHYSLWRRSRRVPQRDDARSNPSTSSSSSTVQHSLVFKAGVLLTSVFLFFITTTLVSFTLQETQERMLQFTFSLQEHVREDRPLQQLIATHVVENLVFVPIMVGMMFFLIEFYGGDKFLAFCVLSIVWVCEVFSIVAIRTIQGMQFFPKIFFLLFTLFHAYFFSCPLGFSYTALASTACFMMHSMVFFWNRYELPAVAHGLVTIERPRMGSNTTTANASVADPLMVPFLEHDGNGADATSSNNVPLVPPRHPLMLQHTSRHSHLTMSSLGRNSTSRPSSSTGLYLRDGDDDDEDESYMYFMNGEVVMHRERRRSPSISTTESLEQNEVMDSHMAASSGDAASGAPTSVPERILERHTVVDSSEQTYGEGAPSESPLAGSLLASRRNTEQVDVDLTPRIGSSSRPEAQPLVNHPVPVFPFWKSERRQEDASQES